jgi:hypothetical protein
LGDFQLDINYYMTTDYQDGQSACRELPAVIEWVNEQLQLMIEQKFIAKQHIKKVEGDVWHSLNLGLWEELGYTEKKTEENIKRAIARHDDVVKATSEYAWYAGWCLRLSNTIISLQAKLDLVRTSESTRRAMMVASDEDNGSET